MSRSSSRLEILSSTNLHSARFDSGNPPQARNGRRRFLLHFKASEGRNRSPGFRVKSGWAAVVLFTGPVGSPVLRDNRMIDLSDPQFPDTRQPYHAAFGQLET